MHSSVMQRMTKEMQLAGLSASTQEVYLDTIDRFVARTGLDPLHATETQVADYLREQIARGLMQNTIVPIKCALQMLFEHALERDWRLFKKESPRRDANACPTFLATANAADSLPPSSIRSTASALH
jgi:hypothetical protein